MAKMEYNISIRIPYDVLVISSTCYFYKPIFLDENVEIENWLERLTQTHKLRDVGCAFIFCVTQKDLSRTLNVCTSSTVN